VTHSAVLLTLDALAVARLTRLVMLDSILAPVRELLKGRKPAQSMDLGGSRIMVAARPRVAELLGCPWCVSPYLAAAVVACQALAAAVWLYVSAVLAFSMVAGLLAERS
jgi:hypothetical protein